MVTPSVFAAIVSAGNLAFDQTDDEASTLQREAGEAGCLANKADGGLLFDNDYQQDEDVNGTPLAKVPTLERIGETFGPDNPNQVNDYYPALPGQNNLVTACVAPAA